MLHRSRIRVFAVSVVLVVALTGCIPITIPLDLIVAHDVVIDLGVLQPGMPFPADFASQEFEFCEEWPDLDALRTWLKEEVGGALANMVQIKGIQPQLIEAIATEGNFSSIAGAELEITLPDSSSIVVSAEPSEDGSRLTITPEDTLDLIGVLETYGGEYSCIQLHVSATGVLPDPNPVFDLRVKGSIIVELGF